jgi:hypothetical protein
MRPPSGASPARPRQAKAPASSRSAATLIGISPGSKLKHLAAAADMRGRGSHALVGKSSPDEVVMAPRKRGRTSSGEWAVLGSNQ